MLSEYTEPFEPDKPASLDTHLGNLFYDSMAREYEDDPGLQDYLPDVIAKEVMIRVNAELEVRLDGEFLIEQYESWLASNSHEADKL